MDENSNKRAVEALEQIWKAIEGISDLLPVKKPVKPARVHVQSGIDPLRLIKRIRGIIKNYNSENAERKLKSLAGLLDGIGAQIEKREAKARQSISPSSEHE